MALVVGVDPGSRGALAIYCSESRRLVDVSDMPTWQQLVGKNTRARVDILALSELFDGYDLLGVKLTMIEEVGGRAKQGNMFAFGYGVGLLYAAAFFSGIPFETVPPATWKQRMRVPGKSKADDSAIMAKANEMFPLDRDKFRGPKGGKRVDRAEAAMIAKYGADHVLGTLSS